MYCPECGRSCDRHGQGDEELWLCGHCRLAFDRLSEWKDMDSHLIAIFAFPMEELSNTILQQIALGKVANESVQPS